MKTMLSGLLFGVLILSGGMATAQTGKTLNVFTWEGYVLPEEVEAVNKLLERKGYDYRVQVIEPWAEGPSQMFDVMRSGNVDISFLTLNYIKMQGGKIQSLLQPINTDSPRLTNYDALNDDLTQISMGMDNGEPLYIPWGGGAYGIWANMDKLSKDELPQSVNDLWNDRWEGKLSLTKGQIQPNIALALMAQGKEPFYINELAGDRAGLGKYSKADTALQRKVNALYDQVGNLWSDGPVFSDDLLLVASYGPGVSAHNAEGGNWELVPFEEGNTVWLDTINFSSELSGRKLEAAEIFANYFIGKKVQERVVEGLGMVAASSKVDSNPLIEDNPNFFDSAMFWPPYDSKANNVMKIISDRAME
ncbi:PotD/PotF family extracellular solute-binding protein [Salicola sp. Rm-C-2C1-2]|uniref:ABC transporter substrate-binding protein n=1 Tax=Salicola sp. Rm-C-2C1-2 TaxID=3141321 RepID=UPI0032E4AA11